VAHRRGLVGEQVRVDVLGGTLAVTLGPSVRLGGPVVHVFDVVVPREPLLVSLDRPTG
jgi:diaminopimelate epimerase